MQSVLAGEGMALMLAATLAPALFGALTMLLPRRAVTARVLLALLGPLASVGALAAYASRFGVVGGTAQGAHGVSFAPSMMLDFTFSADALGLFFALLVSGVGSLIVLYARGYFGRDEENLARFYPPLGLFTTAMMGLVLSDNLLGMVVFWELTSISSFLLIGWDRENRPATRLAVQALVTTGLGGLALLGGVLVLGTATGAWSFSGVVEVMQGGSAARPELLPWAFVLLFLGGATKSAQWPFHYWLPGAMAAPTPVSAFLHSATMVKAGVYLFARLHPAMSGLDWWGPTLAAAGAVTMLLGGYLALRAHELKKIFAYTTVSQLGLFTCAYGLGAWSYQGGPNLVWPVTQILNHALYKAPLFILAGAIMHIASRKTLPALRGLFREHPVLAWTLALAAYAMAGGPLTLSFTAKEAFFYQIVHAAEQAPWLWAVAALAVLTAACNVAIFLRIVLTMAQRAETHGAHDDHHEHERGFWGACIWWPAAALVVWQVIGGVAPGWFGRLVAPLETHALYWESLPGLLHAVTHPSIALAMTGAAFALGAVVGLSPALRGAVQDPHDRLFPSVVRLATDAGWALHKTMQSGNFRRYMYVTLGAVLIGVSSSVLWAPSLLQAPRIALMDGVDFGIRLAAWVAALFVCGSALVIPLVRSRIVRVLTLGVCGFAVTSVYMLLQAPDLALTQLMFEIISIILFLLVLRMLPEEPKVRPRTPWAQRAVFGAVCGLAMGWLVLQVGALTDVNPGGGKLGEWFAAHSYEGTEATGGRGGGGKNVVNVILVDFRGYDTLGEITVLAVAAIGVFVLIGRGPNTGGFSGEGPGRREEDRERTGRTGFDANGVMLGHQPVLTTSLFQTSMRLILPLSLIFAAYLFFKGHQAPGGGFIAGLVASVALAVYRMAEGPGALKKLLPIKPAPLAAAGLTVALLTALAPLALGHEFLRSHTAYVPLPAGGLFHWASVLFFDIGVLIVVVAVSVGVIHRLTEELE